MWAENENTGNPAQQKSGQGGSDQSTTTSTTTTNTENTSSNFQITESEFKRTADTKDLEKR